MDLCLFDRLPVVSKVLLELKTGLPKINGPFSHIAIIGSSFKGFLDGDANEINFYNFIDPNQIPIFINVLNEAMDLLDEVFPNMQHVLGYDEKLELPLI